jgi:hypothetical protein
VQQEIILSAFFVGAREAPGEPGQPNNPMPLLKMQGAKKIERSANVFLLYTINGTEIYRAAQWVK